MDYDMMLQKFNHLWFLHQLINNDVLQYTIAHVIICLIRNKIALADEEDQKNNINQNMLPKVKEL